MLPLCLRRRIPPRASLAALTLLAAAAAPAAPQPAVPLALPPQAAPAASAASAAPMLPGPAGGPMSAVSPGMPDASQRAFASARQQLLQVRTLLRAQDSQASVGSGFLVSEDGHLITNYHVVSQYALRPNQFRLTYATADGRQGALQLLGIDVVHDLALLRPAEPQALAGRGALTFRPEAEVLQRGERIHALGNPLDVGFAVMSGSYNGLVERSFLPTIFFGGSLSAGMSGGPALDDSGRVMGINVAARRDGEQVSFLVPAIHAERLLDSSRSAVPLTEAVHARVAQQVLVYQEELVAAFLAQPWRTSGHARYAIPVPQERFMRCWGRSSAAEERGLRFERSDCTMDQRVFVSSALQLGQIVVRHESYDGRRLGMLRFTNRYSKSFRNESFGSGSRQHTAPQCQEDTVQGQGLPMRAVLCLRGYKKLPGLVDLALLVATLDGADQGVQGRIDAHGVSPANARKLAAHYLSGFGSVAARGAR